METVIYFVGGLIASAAMFALIIATFFPFSKL